MFKQQKGFNKNKTLSLLNIYVCSLNKNLDDLQHLQRCTNKNFDIIAITETRITKNTSIRGNVNKKNYFLGLTPGEPLAGGSFL